MITVLEVPNPLQALIDDFLVSPWVQFYLMTHFIFFATFQIEFHFNFLIPTEKAEEI
jgi:hypothetical protein